MNIIKQKQLLASINNAFLNKDDHLIKNIIQNAPLNLFLSQKAISIARQEGNSILVIFLCTLAIHNDIEKNHAELWLNIYQSIANKHISEYHFKLNENNILHKTLTAIINDTHISPAPISILSAENNELTTSIELLYDFKKWDSLAVLIQSLQDQPIKSKNINIIEKTIKDRINFSIKNHPEPNGENYNTPLFEIIVSGINIDKYIQRCLNSIILQEYKNYRIHILSDNDQNETAKNLKTIQEFNINDNQLFIHCSKSRKGKAELIYDYFQEFKFQENSIAVILDCDDMLYRKSALEIIARTYSNETPDACWSTYIRSDNVLGHSAPLIQGFNHRQQGWRSSHCFTFKAQLLQKVPKDYICDSDSNPVMQACDIAIALPILDISSKTYFIPEVLYLYNVGNPESHHNQIDGFGLSSKRQNETAKYLYTKKPLLIK
jgi:hypothetical protein